MAERNPKGSANVVRRTWDKDKYEQKAKDREEYGDEHVDKPTTNDEEGIRDRQEFRAAEPGAAGEGHHSSGRHGAAPACDRRVRRRRRRR